MCMYMHVVERILFDEHQMCYPSVQPDSSISDSSMGYVARVAWYSCMCMMTEYCISICKKTLEEDACHTHARTDQHFE